MYTSKNSCLILEWCAPYLCVCARHTYNTISSPALIS